MILRSFLTLCFLTPLALYAAPRQAAKVVKTRQPQVVRQHQLDSLFFYSPGEKDGMRIAYKSNGGQFTDIGQIFTSDYARWGAEKRMHTPFVTPLPTGGYAAVFTVNDFAPCIAVAYSEDLIVWRPQDYPQMSVKGCLAPIIKTDDKGKHTILFKTKDGQYRKTETDAKFRHFTADTPATKAEYDAVNTSQKSLTVGGKTFTGNVYTTDSTTIAQVKAYFDYTNIRNQQYSETLGKDDELKARIGKSSMTATITIDGRKQKAISDKLFGVFFEDISYAADGGLYAEMVQNRDFEYTPRDHNGWTSTTAWTSDNDNIQISTDKPLSKNNPHYAIVTNETLTNEGWDGMVVRQGEKYDFSFFVTNIGGKSKTFIVALKDGNKVIAEAKIKTKGKDGQWNKFAAVLTPTVSADKALLSVTAINDNKAGIDMISLFPQETFCNHKNGLRRDLAQAIADLKPKFMRFPGGCMSHGDGLDNIYHWNHTVGPLQDRMPDRNIWHYHQTRGLGFYEYFQFCEDIGAEPLPVLAAGVPCQNSSNDANGYGGQQGGIPMKDMPAYIQEILDMIEWANGDPATSKWAKKRAEAGHPAPFNLKYVGIGNEDIISTTFEERCLMICKAIKERYPDITVCGTVGPFHYPSSDYIEGWKYANEHRDVFDMVDEHYYESVGWFLNNQHYYDNYDRQGSKVYLGEYAANRSAQLDCALAEAAYLCNIERNADVVTMTSYAPLLSKNGHSNWSPDMMYFDNVKIDKSASYHTQRLFSTYSGDRYIGTTVDGVDSIAANRVAASVVKDSKTGKTYLKVANLLPMQLNATLSLKDVPLSSQSLKYEGFSGKQGQNSVEIEKGEYQVRQDAKLEVVLPPYSFRVIEL